jgi:hypothetical protein
MRVRVLSRERQNKPSNSGLESRSLEIPMPVTYQIDAANGIIRTRCIGDVTLEEVLGHFRDLTRDPDGPRHLDVLLDLSEQTSVPESQDMRTVAYEISRVRERVEFGTCAVVASSNALFGMLRMLQVFTEELFSESWVFRTLPEAEAWLEERREAHGSQAEEEYEEQEKVRKENMRTSGGLT